MERSMVYKGKVQWADILTVIPYLASWPIEEHHNNVQDHGKPVKHTKDQPIF